MNNLEKGLKEIGLNVPKSKFHLIMGIIWQFIRMFLDKIHIGVYFSRFAMWYYGVKDMKAYKICALFYYEMHKFSYLNMKSETDFIPKITKITDSRSAKASYGQLNCTEISFYSYLTAIYYILANFNITEMYTGFEKTNKTSEKSTIRKKRKQKHKQN